MDTKAIQVGGQSLVGEYGDVFWTLEPLVIYAAGTEIYTRIYVANPTDIDREYMLMAEVSRAGAVLNEFPVKVDDLTWFTVEAKTVATLPGALLVGYTDCILTLNLYERVQNDVVDSVSATLTTAGVPALPGFPGLPEVDNLLMMMITVMVVVMMMKAVSKETKKDEGGRV